MDEPLGALDPLFGNLAPVRAQGWLEEGKADYGADEREVAKSVAKSRGEEEQRQWLYVGDQI